MQALNPFIDNNGPYELGEEEKGKIFFRKLKELCEFHAEACEPYGNFYNYYKSKISDIISCPYIPVGIFKQFNLRSVDDNNLSKVITSSSTTSNNASKVFVDKTSAEFQRLSVQKIFSSFIGNEPRTYIIFDDKKAARGKGNMSARGAAIMSLMSFASKFFFVMKEREGKLGLDMEELEKALDHAGRLKSFIAYGLTYILYQAHNELKQKEFSYKKWVLKNIYFLHSGGWKRMQEIAVDKTAYNRVISDIWNIESSRIIDFYGLAEHVGIIYPDCPEGNKHVPYFADVIIRDPVTLKPLPPGQAGLIQLISLLAQGGPTHSVITEDLGEIVSIDNCSCGRKGKAFHFNGRVHRAGIRGCGDVYGSK